MLVRWPCCHHFVRLTAVLTLTATLAAGTPKSGLTGDLRREKGVDILRLWGSAREQGYAHGYLLGDRIVGTLRMLLEDPRIVEDETRYEALVRGHFLRNIFRLPDTHRAELEGMLAGIRDRVGARELKLARFDRALDVDDLFALNAMADVVSAGCSSFVAWGDRTTDGGPIVARNLDYLDLPGLKDQHLIIVRTENEDERRRWISVAWPGLIGAYTAMNDEGVVAAMHDVGARPVFQGIRIVPRGLVLRDLIERAAGRNGPVAAIDALRQNPALCGNNFLVAGPSTAEGAAIVYEYDGKLDVSDGVTVRVPQPTEVPHAIACTNHYRLRAAPPPCWRYDRIVGSLRKADQSLDVDGAWKILRSVANETTIHSMVARPREKDLWLSLASRKKHAGEHRARHFTLDALFQRP